MGTGWQLMGLSCWGMKGEESRRRSLGLQRCWPRSGSGKWQPHSLLAGAVCNAAIRLLLLWSCTCYACCACCAHLHQNVLHHVLAAQQVEAPDALVSQVRAVAGLQVAVGGRVGRDGWCEMTEVAARAGCGTAWLGPLPSCKACHAAEHA